MHDAVPQPTAVGETLLTTADWQTRARAHLEKVQPWTTPFRERRSRRAVHPVYDFMFTYYSYTGGRLEKWHPEFRTRIVDSPEARDRFTEPLYRVSEGTIQQDLSAITPTERQLLDQVLHVMGATRERAANFGCYGMHEWAMVYGGHDVRHAEIAPLRLPQQQVDAFVESRPIACSHFDAFRFFAPPAQPLNRVSLAWATRHDAEQPGCIHANMDLYRWAYTSMPWIGSDLLWECFELALELRVLDMQAGPYDLSAIGFEPVRVETAAGRAEYQQRQRALSSRSSELRNRLIDAVAAVVTEATRAR